MACANIFGFWWCLLYNTLNHVILTIYCDTAITPPDHMPQSVQAGSGSTVGGVQNFLLHYSVSKGKWQELVDTVISLSCVNYFETLMEAQTCKEIH